MIRYIKAAVVFIIWLYFRNTINTWSNTFSFFLHILGIGIPIFILLEPYLFKFSNYPGFKNNEDSKKNYQDEWLNDFAERVARESNEYNQQTHAQSNEQSQYKPKSLLTTEQIAQLNTLRDYLNLKDAEMYPAISISGACMPNLVVEAGIFTAKIKRNGEIMNLVVMLATNKAVQDFERVCYSYGALEKDFWCKGYLIPQRTDRCYSILYVYKIRVNGKEIIF